MKQGYFTFVLHTHLPYVRRAGRWPHGEEIVHEAMAETYIPLLDALYDLNAEGHHPKVTIGLTPILLEQIADPDVLASFERYLGERIALAHADAERLAGVDAQRAQVARFYGDVYSTIRAHYETRYQRDLVGAFRRLAEDGTLEILTSAATHGYLPLLGRDSSIYGQLKTGMTTTLRHLGQLQRGIWLPECGYRPAVVGADQQSVRPGIEEILNEFGLQFFFTDSHVVEGAATRGPSQACGSRPAPATRTTQRPYYVGSTRVAVFARDAVSDQQVWSSDHGYPGAPEYREFHRRDLVSGLRYWRVTRFDTDIIQGGPYDPDAALARTRLDADHFVRQLERRVAEDSETRGQPGLIVSAFDTELFGHWWFEGVAWLKEVLRRLERHERVGLTTAGTYLDQFPPTEALNLPTGSWGAGGAHWAWRNPETAWIWPLLHAAERRLERLVEAAGDPDPSQREQLNQAARELLLLQSSDWPFLITTNQATAYAALRFERHLARFNHLVASAQANRGDSSDRRFLQTTHELDNPFPDIDYRWFMPRDARVAATS